MSDLDEQATNLLGFYADQVAKHEVAKVMKFQVKPLYEALQNIVDTGTALCQSQCRYCHCDFRNGEEHHIGCAVRIAQDTINEALPTGPAPAPDAGKE